MKEYNYIGLIIYIYINLLKHDWLMTNETVPVPTLSNEKYGRAHILPCRSNPIIHMKLVKVPKYKYCELQYEFGYQENIKQPKIP